LIVGVEGEREIVADQFANCTGLLDMVMDLCIEIDAAVVKAKLDRRRRVLHAHFDMAQHFVEAALDPHAVLLMPGIEFPVFGRAAASRALFSGVRAMIRPWC
jgi:hypothetical protein